MNVMITIFTTLLVLHLPTFAFSLQDPFQLKPILKKTFHYELLHPKLSNSVPRSVTYLNGPQVSAQFSPPFLPPPKLTVHRPPLVPDILNNLFQQRSSSVKEVPDNHLDHLFTPNTINEPAVTVGQIENYRKDLEEQAMEEEQEQKNAASEFGKLNVPDESAPKLHVTVNSGLYNYNYTLQRK